MFVKKILLAQYNYNYPSYNWMEEVQIQTSVSIRKKR